MDKASRDIVIRAYEPRDRAALRVLCFETSFLGQPRLFVDSAEITADVLSLYFTDCEPESSFVACAGEELIGYLIGARDVRRLSRVFSSRIFFSVLGKSIASGVFFQPKSLRFVYYCGVSFFKGEFLPKPLRREYPALLHINVRRDFRGQGVGRSLLGRFMEYLTGEQVFGVHVSTLEEQGKDFFLKQGFKILYSSPKTFLRYRLGRGVTQYILGKSLSG